MDVALVESLTSGSGRALLDSLGDYADQEALALSTRLRAQGHDPGLVTAALAQARLRARAAEKFGSAAATLLFTADGLEQATRPELADRHAERFVGAGIDLVHDLGCGIGSDARAFAAAGMSVDAVDADPVTAAVAAANLRERPGTTVRCLPAQEVALPAGEAARHTGVWADPARRVSGVRAVDGRARRVFSLQAIEPSWEQVCRWAAQVPATGAKLSPAFPHGALPSGAEAQWTSWRAEVLECVVWWGPLVQTPGRTAAVCRPGSPPAVVTEADLRPAQPIGSLDDLGPWLLEADRAIVRAGLTGALPGRELSPGIGYATDGAASTLPWLRSYAVIEAMPLRPKVIRSWLRSHEVGRVTVKKRGSAVDPERLRREVTAGLARLEGEATLVVTTIAGTGIALVVEAG